MNWSIESLADGSFQLVDESGNALCSGTLEDIEEHVDEIIEELEDLKQSLWENEE